MTDITQQHIAVLVKRLRTTVMPRRTSPQDKAIIDNLMDAADMLEHLSSKNIRLREVLEKIADRPDYRLPKPQDIARAALQAKPHE